MIVKNEEKYLPRALANLGGFYDELIIVDTGSTDRTVAIARAHGAYVISYEWESPGHKGKARNIGIRNAAGDWIVVLDADERIREPQKLRELIENTPPAIACYSPLFEFFNEDKMFLQMRDIPRIFRRGHYQYRYREHELPFPMNGGHGKIKRTEFVFEHYAKANPAPLSSGPHANKMTDMLVRLLLDAQENPQSTDRMYFLCAHYGVMRQWNECLYWGKRFLQVDTAGGNHLTCTYHQVAVASATLGDYSYAIECLKKVIALEPGAKRHRIALAECNMKLQQWDVALALLRGTQAMKQGEVFAIDAFYEESLPDLIQQCQDALRCEPT